MTFEKLGDWCKWLEKNFSNETAIPTLPVIIRLDGNNFSKWTKGLKKPFDDGLIQLMIETTRFLVEETNAVVGYTQSDEITLILFSDDRRKQIYNDGKKQKVLSKLTAQCVSFFNENRAKYLPNHNKTAFFDCRIYQCPTLHDAAVQLLWRENDAIKNNLIPANIKSRIEGHYFNEFDGLILIVQKEAAKNSEVIIDLHNYFGNITIEEFKNVDGLNNSNLFKSNINAYIRYYFLDSKHLAFSKEKFLEEKEFIQSNFEGEIENYAMARMFRDYHLKGFGKSMNTIELLKNSIDEYEDKFTKPSYIEFMNGIKEDLKSYNFELRESVLNSKFININGDTLSLKKIFARSKNTIKVIDFF